MSYQDVLIASRDQIANRISEATAQYKPSYSIDGKSVSHAEYLRTLFDELREIETAIQRADGPFEVRSRGV